jgi:hypothetical protein
MTVFTREMSEAYRQSSTLPKMSLLRRLFAEAQGLPYQHNGVSPAHQLTRVFHFLSAHPDEIIPDIHDLWSEYVFAQGYVYGESRSDIEKTAPLLKPFSYFTTIEQALERMLVMEDMKSLAAALCQHLPEIPENDDLLITKGELVGYLHGERVVSLALFLSSSDDFIHDASRLIHNNWRSVTAQLGWAAGDPRTVKPFDGLSPEEKIITLENVRSDIEAVALFVHRHTLGQLERLYEASEA